MIHISLVCITLGVTSTLRAASHELTSTWYDCEKTGVGAGGGDQSALCVDMWSTSADHRSRSPRAVRCDSHTCRLLVSTSGMPCKSPAVGSHSKSGRIPAPAAATVHLALADRCDLVAMSTPSLAGSGTCTTRFPAGAKRLTDDVGAVQQRRRARRSLGVDCCGGRRMR